MHADLAVALKFKAEGDSHLKIYSQVYKREISLWRTVNVMYTFLVDKVSMKSVRSVSINGYY